MMLRGTSWDTITENLGAVRRLRPPLCPLADALEPLLAIVHREAQVVAVPQIRLVEPDARNDRGLPILPRAQFPIDLEGGMRVFRELAAVAAGGPGEARQPTLLLTEQADDAEWLKGVLLAHASGGLEVNASGADVARAQQLAFLAGMALRPSLEAAATHLSRWASTGWVEATCPVCGARPRLAERRAPEGRRHLHCAFCGFAWQYATIGCPACGNQEPEQLQLLYVAEDRRSRLDLCDACRTYLKCIDNKEYSGIVPLVEDLLSPHLDVLAVEKGYQPITD